MKVSVIAMAAITCALGFAVQPKLALADSTPPVPFMEQDGTYVVGRDIRSGLYETGGATGPGMCSWSRLSSVGSGGGSGVIDRGESRDAQYALIAPTDRAFETHGCQAWSTRTRTATPIDPIQQTCIYPLTGCVDPNESRPSP